ncbi:MAG: D-ribose pyranase [Burkholderiales bacterium PBB5]|nr:MAG: D-ribose pyranase [Burkholderiales bacterium PBB5]
MKKTPLLHAELSHLVATLGHGDAVVIADAGLPVPAGTRCIDLALTRGVPSFAQVLDAVLSEMQVERADQATEVHSHSPQIEALLRARLGGAPLHSIPHDDFKQRTRTARAVIRTGECTPYANVILYAGVVF